ncbi:hypothetical protein [Halobacillus naozhouensis]|uniref:YlaH-like protein n=1 Tax=Halobacillus naozhouensis TaxID=554880 RepID=A0ABY8J1J1_9BACI|nr:hypothetical protein [Halobacillus naozhouensis]WFT76368.1 hypothetical protein P9989_08395 [Halobacillus naozhouensis]
MEFSIELVSWPIFILFLIIHGVLLFFKQRKKVLYSSMIMIAFGTASMILGLIHFQHLGVYGVIVILVGLVIYISTKDLIEKG